MACAGLERLELAGRIRCELSPEQSLPAIGQGVLGIEIRADDTETADIRRFLNLLEIIFVESNFILSIDFLFQ